VQLVKFIVYFIVFPPDRCSLSQNIALQQVLIVKRYWITAILAKPVRSWLVAQGCEKSLSKTQSTGHLTSFRVKELRPASELLSCWWKRVDDDIINRSVADWSSRPWLPWKHFVKVWILSCPSCQGSWPRQSAMSHSGTGIDRTTFRLRCGHGTNELWPSYVNTCYGHIWSVSTQYWKVWKIFLSFSSLEKYGKIFLVC